MDMDREITAKWMLTALRKVDIEPRELDGVSDALAMQEALATIPVVPHSPVDDLVSDLDAGDISPEQLPERVEHAVHHTHTKWNHNEARSSVAERIAARLLRAIKSHLPEIHRQLSEQFDQAASQLVTAVTQLGDINDASEALDQGREKSWRAVQTASGQLDILLEAVTKLSTIGHGSQGNTHLWGLDVLAIESVDALPREKPRDPLGRWVAWARQGQTFALADGNTKKQRDQHVLTIKANAHNPIAPATPAARATSWGEVTTKL